MAKFLFEMKIGYNSEHVLGGVLNQVIFMKFLLVLCKKNRYRITKTETALRGQVRHQGTAEIEFLSAPESVAVIMSTHMYTVRFSRFSKKLKI